MTNTRKSMEILTELTIYNLDCTLELSGECLKKSKYLGYTCDNEIRVSISGPLLAVIFPAP